MKVSVALTGDEYADALQVSSARGIVGGGIYDAMLGQCAIKTAGGNDLHMECATLCTVRTGSDATPADLRPASKDSI